MHNIIALLLFQVEFRLKQRQMFSVDQIDPSLAESYDAVQASYSWIAGLIYRSNPKVRSYKVNQAVTSLQPQLISKNFEYKHLFPNASCLRLLECFFCHWLNFFCAFVYIDENGVYDSVNRLSKFWKISGLPEFGVQYILDYPVMLGNLFPKSWPDKHLAG